MNLKDRLKKISEKLHSTAKPIPGKVFICLTEAEEKTAREACKKLSPNVPRFIITTKDYSLPKPKTEIKK
jgi:hypothetical protein